VILCVIGVVVLVLVCLVVFVCLGMVLVMSGLCGMFLGMLWYEYVVIVMDENVGVVFFVKSV